MPTLSHDCPVIVAQPYNHDSIFTNFVVFSTLSVFKLESSTKQTKRCINVEVQVPILTHTT